MRSVHEDESGGFGDGATSGSGLFVGREAELGTLRNLAREAAVLIQQGEVGRLVTGLEKPGATLCGCASLEGRI